MIKRLLFWLRSIGKPRCPIHPAIILTVVPNADFKFCHECAAIAFNKAHDEHRAMIKAMILNNRPKNAPVALRRPS